jgi:hypothetical protein
MLDLGIKSFDESMKEYYQELWDVANVIEKLQPDTLKGFKTTYHKLIIDGDLFYTGKTLKYPQSPIKIAVILTEEQKQELLKEALYGV